MAYDNQTDLGGSREAFLTTQWSLIAHIREDEDRDQARIGFLIEQYWKPVYCFLRRKGYENESAKDLTQAFFHEVVLNQSLVKRADQARGRLRTFLHHALIKFISKQNLKDRAKKRIPREKLVYLDQADTLDLPDSLSGAPPEASFHHAWLSALLERVLEVVRESCKNDGLETHWALFHKHVMGPILYDRPKVLLGDLCDSHKIKDTKTASNMIITVKRRYRSTLLDQVNRTVLSHDQASDELADLMTYLPTGAMGGSA
jgi:RNA polymerase sigma-70 factor (ECF subfamily)